MSDLGKKIAESIAKRISEGPKGNLKRKYGKKVATQQDVAKGIKRGFEGKFRKSDSDKAP